MSDGSKTRTIARNEAIPSDRELRTDALRNFDFRQPIQKSLHDVVLEKFLKRPALLKRLIQQALPSFLATPSVNRCHLSKS